MHRFARAGWMAVAASLALAGTAAADWLVTKQGDRIETRGAWRRQGAVIVFTLPNGTLSSLRAEEVDLDASARASAPAAAAPSPAPEAKKKPVLVLRDKDVAHVGPDAEAATEAGQPVVKDKGAAAGQAQVSVINWHQEAGEDGLVVSGAVQNSDAKLTATEVTVNVRVFDADGKVQVSGPASLSSATLPPGKSATFKVTFPNTGKPAALKFDVTSASAPTPPKEQ